MQTHAKDALDEAHQTVHELAMYLVRVAGRSEAEERNDLMMMAAALARLSGRDVPSEWKYLPTHTANCVPA